MKKKLILGIALAGMLCSGCGARAIMTKADGEDQKGNVVNLINGFLNDDACKGVYTKKTQIFLTEKAKADMVDVFHAKHNVLERTTYYDENANALLMGDYDGGFESINSGYRKVIVDEVTKMEHYRYAGDNSTKEDYFTNATHDYYVNATTPNDYFVNLTGLASTISKAGVWTTDGSTFYHDFADITINSETGDYNDPILKAVQYFAAPMLLQNTEYFTPKYVSIANCQDWLSIRLYVDHGDYGMVTVFNETQALLAEARVFKGLVEEPTYKVTGKFDDWTNGVALEYAADAFYFVQYKATLTMGQYIQFGISYGGNWYNYNDLENKDWFQDVDNNIETKLTERSYTIYFKPTAGDGQKIWIAVEEIATINVKVIVPSGWFDNGRKLTVHVWGQDDATAWPGKEIATSGTVGETTINGYNQQMVICSANGTNAEIQTCNVNITYNDVTVTILDLTTKDGAGHLTNFTVTKTVA